MRATQRQSVAALLITRANNARRGILLRAALIVRLVAAIKPRRVLTVASRGEPTSRGQCARA
jgi:hypothetical protein